MKKFLVVVLSSVLLMSLIPVASAGDCTKRTEVEWQATIKSAVYVRVDCPSGDIVGTAPAGERVEILEVDNHGDFYLIRTSVGTGFVYNSYLKDIVKSPLVVESETKAEVKPIKYENSIFGDLNPSHKYYDEIAEVKAKGIVGGNPDGSIEADAAINRAALAKILVEATNEDEAIAKASLGAGVYSDVELGAWYTPYLKIAKDMNVMTGDSGKATVRPGDKANGAEVAKMIAIAFEIEVREKKAWEQWYTPYFEALGELEALPYVDGNHKVTRAEMMFMISVVLEAQESNTSSEPSA
jgi:hypothetical protein